MGIVYKIVLFLFLVLTGIFRAPAQPGQYQFDHIDIYDGLSHDQVNCILRDDQGFMWFGTLSGLDRYDGYSFKVFHHDIWDSTSLNDNYITGIFKLPDGKLWVTTRIGANIYDPATEQFNRNYNRYLKTLSLPTGLIHQVVENKNNDHHFIKMPELALFYNEITDYKTAKHTHLDKPALDETLVNIKPTPEQSKFIKNLMQFAKTGNGELIVRGRLTPKEDKGRMLIATNYAKKWQEICG